MGGDDAGDALLGSADPVEGQPASGAPRSELPHSEPNGTRSVGDGPTLPPRPDLPTVARASAAPTTPPEVAPTGTTAAPAWYRSEEERSRSVYRRANPWWRRLLRGLIAFGLLAIAGVGLYYGARALQDYLDQDRLPAAGAETPDYRSTTFQVRSSPPAPDLNGTLSIDTETGAFEFIGRSGGRQSDVQAVSTDGSTVYVRRGGGPWLAAPAGSPLVGDLERAIVHLTTVDTADDILTPTIRDGYVDLVDRTTEGEGETELTRYQITIDTAALSEEQPLEWQTFTDEVIPSAVVSDALPLTMWIDRHNALVRLRDDSTAWTWERLTYSSQPFVPTSPTGS